MSVDIDKWPNTVHMRHDDITITLEGATKLKLTPAVDQRFDVREFYNHATLKLGIST